VIDYSWCGQFANAELNALHAEGFGHRLLDDDWQAQVSRHSLGWVCAREGDDLIGFVNSAPSQYTTNSENCGGEIVTADDAAYGTYIATIVSHFKAAGVSISDWLLAFSMFIFLSLAFAKRHVELRHALDENGKLRSRAYQAQDLTMVASLGTTAGYLAVLVFCLYIESSAGTVVYSQPRLLWLICPVLLYWISRVWFLTNRGEMDDDPVRFAITDRASWLCALALGGVATAARFWPS